MSVTVFLEVLAQSSVLGHGLGVGAKCVNMMSSYLPKCLTADLEASRKASFAFLVYTTIYTVRTSANRKNIVDLSCAGDDTGIMSTEMQ